MRKFVIISVLMMLAASIGHAATFAPTPTKIEGDNTILYAFDGSTLTIPVRVSGTAALVKFMVFTSGKSGEINNVKNGYLGWHFVDKIDTCLYMSPDNYFLQGTQNILWNGKDEDGGVVPKGDYTYYLWGYDNVSDRIKAIPRSMGTSTNENIIVVDDQGVKLAQPIFHSGRTDNWRWKLGNDPDNTGLVETCRLNLPTGWTASDYGHWLVDPRDNTVVYGRSFNATTATGKSRKFHWVPNDVGSEDNVFGVEFSPLNNYSGQEYDDTYMYYCECNYKETTPRTYVHIIDYASTAEGEYVGFIDQTQVHQQVDAYNQYKENGALQVLMNNGYTQTANFKERGWIIGGVHCSCLRVAFEPRAWFDDSSDDTVRWVNGNGDGIFDFSDEPTSQKPWVCSSTGVPGPSNHGWGIDNNGFIYGGIIRFAYSFHGAAPDGTGIGKYAFSGEVTVGAGRGGMCILDDNTAFDGAYCPKAVGDGTDSFLTGTYWVGCDSFKGKITDVVSVEDTSPTAFTVAQNTPNPFNPSTTISFALAKSGDVSVEVFNVAGQKIATLADGYHQTGAHSLVWDASGQAAGVYFYTIKSGNMSKTMKMTLIR